MVTWTKKPGYAALINMADPKPVMAPRPPTVTPTVKTYRYTVPVKWYWPDADGVGGTINVPVEITVKVG